MSGFNSCPTAFALDQSAMWAGRMKNDSKSDASRARVTTSGITRMKSPITPGSSMRGRNAAMVVMAEVSTGVMTSLVPTTAASRGDIPRCM